MSAESGTDLSSGQAVPSLNQRGNDEFSSMLGGDSGGQSQQQQSTETTQTKHEGTAEKPPLETVVPSKPAADGQQQTQQLMPQAPQMQQTPSAFDPNVLKQIVDASVMATQTAQANAVASTAQIKQDQKELTPAEFAAKYHIPTIDESTIQAIMDQDPKKGAAMLRQLLLGNVQTAVLMAKDVFDTQLKTMREEMAPHVSSWQAFQKEQREAKLESDFYTQYPALVAEKPLVREMQNAIFGRIASGQLKPFDRPEDALKAVADAAQSVLARMNKQAGVGGVGQQQSQQQTQQGQGQRTSQRQMTAALTAGQSGSGQTAGRTDEETIFGKDYV